MRFLIKISFIFLWCLLTQFTSGQTSNLVLVYLKDKGSQSLDKDVRLSQKSLNRRTKQGIALSTSDLPLNPNHLLQLQSLGFNILKASRWLNAVVVDPNQSTTPLLSLPFVAAVEPIACGSMKIAESKATAGQDQPTSDAQLEMIGLRTLHDNGFTGKGVTIAVFDNGFMNIDLWPVFRHVWQEKRILAVRNFVRYPDSIGYSFRDGDGEHGGRVFSVLACLDAPNMVGSAFDANFILGVTEDNRSESELEEINWLMAAEWADSLGADIISSSLGYANHFSMGSDHTYSQLDGHTTIISKAANLAASKGILVVNSAGNEGASEWQYIMAPADADSCLAVGAVDDKGHYGSFSSKGHTFDGRIKPDVAAMGVQTTTFMPEGFLKTGNGTSFSCPLVSGMAACLMQALPQATNMQLLQAIKATASQATNPDTLLGYGIPDALLAYAAFGNVSIELTPIHHNMLTVLPNPIHDLFEVVFYNYDSAWTGQIEFVDMLGQCAHTEQLNFAHGYNVWTLSAKALNMHAGAYVLKTNGIPDPWQFKQKILVIP